MGLQLNAMKNLIVRKFTQSGDDHQNEDEPQTISISSLDSGAGTFVNIETSRWSFCKPEEIDDFCKELKDALSVNVLPNNR